MSFLNPILALAGVALVAIPVIIHILNRRRFKRVKWAAMEFLLRAAKKNRKRLRFESWLLLLTRCAVVALIGMALARPMGCRDGALAQLAGRPSGLHVIVLDTSGSMNYQRADGTTNFDVAQDVARRIVERLDTGGERVAVVTAGKPARLLFGEPTFDLAAATDALSETEAGFGGADLVAALGEAVTLGEFAADEPTRVLHLITDAASGAWSDPATTARLAELGPTLETTFTNVVHHDVADDGPTNRAVTDLGTSAGLIRSGFNNTLEATVRGFGATAPIDVAAALDEQSIPLTTNTLTPTPAGEPLLISPNLTEGGRHVLEVRAVGQDPLPIDDVRRGVLDVAAALPVLIVEGRRGINPLDGSGFLLDTALAPPSDEAAPGVDTRSYVRTELISDLELESQVLGTFRAVYLADVGNVSSAAADALEKYVDEGGTLFVFLGTQVDIDGYNQTLGERGLLPGAITQLIRVEGEGRRIDFDPNDVLHPFLDAFKMTARTGLDTATVSQYFRVSPSVDSAETVLALQPEADRDADPLIVAHRLGAGQVVTVTTSAALDVEWTTLTSKPVFVSLVHELLSKSAGGGDRWLNVAVGEAVVVPAVVRVTETPVLTDGQGDSVLLERGEDGVWRSGPMGEPGLLTLDVGTASFPIAVNMPAAESDVRRLDEAALREALGGIELTIADVTADVGIEESANDFGWPLLLAVLLLAASETWMALKFGHSGG
ncbi:MAG: BatA domain-containing protein [Planctomycetota bacterium]